MWLLCNCDCTTVKWESCVCIRSYCKNCCFGGCKIAGDNICKISYDVRMFHPLLTPYTRPYMQKKMWVLWSSLVHGRHGSQHTLFTNSQWRWCSVNAKSGNPADPCYTFCMYTRKMCIGWMASPTFLNGDKGYSLSVGSSRLSSTYLCSDPLSTHTRREISRSSP